MSELKPKTMKESQVTMIELVLPNDTNILKNLLGGRLMHWMDIAAAMAASRHCHNVAVTAVVDDLSFLWKRGNLRYSPGLLQQKRVSFQGLQ